jgi:predicted dienelactone hydrolase
MRPFEFLMCCFVVPVSLALLAGMRLGVREMHVFCLLLLVVTITHVVHDGPHWQLFPLYLAVLALLLMSLAVHTLDIAPVATLRWTGLASLLLVAASGVFSYVLPMFHLPATTGPYSVGTSILYMDDPGRDTFGEKKSAASGEPGSKRELVVQLWYPASASANPWAVYRRRKETTATSSYQSVLRTASRLDAPVFSHGGPWPLLLFNPAWTGQRTQSTFLMQELASHGFLVASIDHTWYSGRVAFPDGRVIDSSRAPKIGNFDHSTVAEQLALGSKYTLIEAEDDIFVLDQMLALSSDRQSRWFGSVDPTRIGALGHSIGGSAAEQACYLDPRIRAALNMDGWTFGDVLAHGLNKPLMLMYEKGTILEPPASQLSSLPESAQRYWQMDRENNAAVEAGLRRFGGFRLSIDGTSHWNFSDRALYSPLRSRTAAGSIAPMRAYNIIDRYAVAFFSLYLRGTSEPLLFCRPSPFSEVDFERISAQKTPSGDSTSKREQTDASTAAETLAGGRG